MTRSRRAVGWLLAATLTSAGGTSAGGALVSGCGLVLDAAPHHDAGLELGMDAALDAPGLDAFATDDAVVAPLDAPSSDAPTADAPGMDAPSADAPSADAPSALDATDVSFVTTDGPILPEPDAIALDAFVPVDAACPDCTPLGACDAPTCAPDGTCVHAPAALGTVCRDVAGPCDVLEVCDGRGLACPADRAHPRTWICRAGGVCDPPERCDGSTSLCPPDVNGFEWNGGCASGVCSGRTCMTSATCTAGAPCVTACVAGVVRCAPGPSCMPTATALPAGAVCRPSLGSCDAPELCTGDMACPTDHFLGTDTVCRAAAGPCDQPESCTADSPSCPSGDRFVPSGTPCGDTGCGQCSGTSALCHAPRPIGASCMGGHCDGVGECLADSSVCVVPGTCDLGRWSGSVCMASRPAGVADDGAPCARGDGMCTPDSVCLGGSCLPASASAGSCVGFCPGFGLSEGVCVAETCLPACPPG